MARTAEAEARGCYCDDARDPGGGLPPGHCGWCQTCGRPGHMRHAPGAPVTGAWCDRHFALLCWFHPLAPRGKVVWTVALVGAAVVLGLLRR